ncbi:hypothetical protein BG97_3188 [Burkholderia pseudomallei 7894]|nr:hypothetical protein BG97_3188 [Burkholderia pseudomallei 7894]
MFAWRDNRWMGPLRGQKMAVFAHFLSKIGHLSYFRVRNIG